LNRPQVGAALQEMRRERVAQQMGMDALGLETRLLRELSQDEERPRPGERAALRVEEDLGPVPLVEIRAAAAQVALQRRHGLTADRHDPLLRALADHAHEPLLEVDAGADR